MDLEYSDIVSAITDGIRAAKDDDDVPRPICPIKPIEGVDSAGREVEAVAVVWVEDMLQFIAIVTDPDDDDGRYPITVKTIYPPGTPAQDLPEPIMKARGSPPAAFRKPITWPDFDSRFSGPGETRHRDGFEETA